MFPITLSIGIVCMQEHHFYLSYFLLYVKSYNGADFPASQTKKKQQKEDNAPDVLLFCPHLFITKIKCISDATGNRLVNVVF